MTRKVGDFRVPAGDQEKAEETFEQLPPLAQRVDKATRQPVAESLEAYREMPFLRDYPGVDTQQDNPKLAVMDDVDFDATPGPGEVTAVEETGFSPAEDFQSIGELPGDVADAFRE